MKELGRQLKLNEAILRFVTTRAPARKAAPPPAVPAGATEEVP